LNIPIDDSQSFALYSGSQKYVPIKDNELKNGFLLTSWVCDFGIFEFVRLNRKNSGGALKQLAMLNAGQIQKLFPKSHNVVRKTPFSISTAYTETEHIFENYSILKKRQNTF